LEKCLSATRTINRHISTHADFKNVLSVTRSIDITYGHTQTNINHFANTITIIF